MDIDSRGQGLEAGATGKWQRRDPRPYESGNTAALKHGADSRRLLSPVVDRLRQELAGVAPWTSLAMFARDVEAWAWAEAQCELYRAWFDMRGLIDEAGYVVAGYDRWQRAEATAASGRARLGLTPSAWARLVSSLGSTDGEAAARSLEALKATGRELASAALGALPETSCDDV